MRVLLALAVFALPLSAANQAPPVRDTCPCTGKADCVCAVGTCKCLNCADFKRQAPPVRDGDMALVFAPSLEVAPTVAPDQIWGYPTGDGHFTNPNYPGMVYSRTEGWSRITPAPQLLVAPAWPMQSFRSPGCAGGR
jgi:hypothetical protein